MSNNLKSVFQNAVDNIIGIDLGSSSTGVYVRKKGVIYREPTLCAERSEDKKALAFGKEAENMIGKTPKGVRVLRLCENSAIKNYDKTTEFLSNIMKSLGNAKIFHPKVIICTSGILNDVERRALETITLEAGASGVSAIDETIASAIGIGINVKNPRGNLIVNIGGGTVNAAVITMGGIAASESSKFAGDEMTKSIIYYIKNKFDIKIGESEAEKIKYNSTEFSRIIGKNMHNLLPGVLDIYMEELFEATEDVLYKISETIRAVLSKTSPELCVDILENGITLCGGASLLYKIDNYLMNRLNLPISIAKKPENVAIEGIGKIIENNSYEVILTYSKRHMFGIGEKL